jgi:hypothetical protein
MRRKVHTHGVKLNFKYTILLYKASKGLPGHRPHMRPDEFVAAVFADEDVFNEVTVVAVQVVVHAQQSLRSLDAVCMHSDGARAEVLSVDAAQRLRSNGCIARADGVPRSAQR